MVPPLLHLFHQRIEYECAISSNDYTLPHTICHLLPKALLGLAKQTDDRTYPVVGRVAAEQAAHSTAADQAFHPSRVKSVPEKGSLMPKVTLICSCTSIRKDLDCCHS